MRFLLICLMLIQFSTNFAKTQSLNAVKASNSIASKFPSKRENGGTIEQLIGGHVLYRNLQKNSHNKLRKNHRKSVSRTPNALGIQNSSNYQNEKGITLETASTGNGKLEKKTNSTSIREEGKKTLSDQVNEGKYGLIHTELFNAPIKRPGVLSYKSNHEVPTDDVNNYGGLKDDEIWLSEDHLLVLNGGSVNKINLKEKWKPIDDYVAPERQVKIPSNPKVPPPFPVQLADNAPIQFIGNNKLPIYNPFTNQTVFLFSNDRVPDIQTGDFAKKNTSARNGEKNPPATFNGYQYPPPSPLPIGEPNKTFSNPFLNLPPLPTGSIDETNTTDFDDDDNSLYYPPPYTFEYKSNYSSPVSPGPLVPGIILPPPPNFFAPLIEMEIPTKTPSSSKKIISNSRINESPKNVTTNTDENSPKYNIEIEKIAVQVFSFKNDTSLDKSIPPPLPMHSEKMRHKVKMPSTAKTHIQKDNVLEHSPLISLNQLTVKGNPIYFEYFDARTSTEGPGNEYSFTTPKPLTTTTSKIRYGTTSAYPPIRSQIISKLPPIKTYLPSNQKELAHIVPDVRSHRYKTMHEFNKEIENIRHTLLLYKHSAPLANNYRKPKARTNYGISALAGLPQIHTSYVNSQYPASSDQFPPDVKYQPFNAGLPHHFNPIGVPQWHSSRLPAFDNPDSLSHNLNRYRDSTLNVEITSSSPHFDFTIQTPKPTAQYSQLSTHDDSWFHVEKVKVVEIPKPLIYNNGASGYNKKIYMQNKYSIPSYSPHAKSRPSTSSLSSINIGGSYGRSDIKKYDTFSQLQTQDLAKDTLINYKNPLPAINFDSELLPYNARKSKPMIDYKPSGNQAGVFYITPQKYEYQ